MKRIALCAPHLTFISNGGHTDAPNVKYFIQWADGFIKHAPK